MKEYKKYFDLWCFSLVLLLITLALFVAFIKSRTVVWLIALALFAVTFCVLYRICIKKLTLDEGYTVIDALSFYKHCSGHLNKKSCSNSYKLQKELFELSSDFDFCKDMSGEQLLSLYKFAEQVASKIKVPKIIDLIFMKGGK